MPKILASCLIAAVSNFSLQEISVPAGTEGLLGPAGDQSFWYVRASASGRTVVRSTFDGVVSTEIQVPRQAIPVGVTSRLNAVIYRPDDFLEVNTKEENRWELVERSPATVLFDGGLWGKYDFQRSGWFLKWRLGDTGPSGSVDSAKVSINSSLAISPTHKSFSLIDWHSGRVTSFGFLSRQWKSQKQLPAELRGLSGLRSEARHWSEGELVLVTGRRLSDFADTVKKVPSLTTGTPGRVMRTRYVSIYNLLTTKYEVICTFDTETFDESSHFAPRAAATQIPQLAVEPGKWIVVNCESASVGRVGRALLLKK